MNPSMLDMRSLAKAAYEEISSSDQKLRTKLKLGKLHKVFGDANLLRIIWNNLISNAIKYSSKEKISEIGIKSQIKYDSIVSVSYTHLRAHETVLDLVCRLLLEKKK